MGPNLDAEALSLPPLPQEDLVNKVDYDWDKHAAEYWADRVTNTWEHIKTNVTHQSRPKLKMEALNDVYQTVFVKMVM